LLAFLISAMRNTLPAYLIISDCKLYIFIKYCLFAGRFINSRVCSRRFALNKKCLSVFIPSFAVSDLSGWSWGNVLDFCFGGIRFGSRPGYKLSCVIVNPSRRISVQYLQTACNYLLPNHNLLNTHDHFQPHPPVLANGRYRALSFI